MTVTNVVGYIIAFAGVLWYNYLRMPRPTDASAPATSSAQAAPEGSDRRVDDDGSGMDPEGQPLLSTSHKALEVEGNQEASRGNQEASRGQRKHTSAGGGGVN